MTSVDYTRPVEGAWRPRRRLRAWTGRAFFAGCLGAVGVGLVMLGALIVDVSLDGAARLFDLPALSDSALVFGLGLAVTAPPILISKVIARPPAPLRRPVAILARVPLVVVALIVTGWVGYLFLDQAFIGNFASRFPARAGVYAALIGTLYMMAITVAVAFPLGVGAAIYLEEYARQNWFTRLIQINISNLAGVPSIVYGLLGLQVFVRVMELERSVLAGALTMALLVMPIIIVSAQEALRAVPPSMREGAYALGATRWQVVRHAVLPYALGGMLTGNILAMSRAIGETAPLIMIGALTFIAFLPQDPLDPFTVLPIQIFNWISRPQAEFQTVAAAAILLLLLVLLAMNSVAIIMRHRTRVRW